jgi:hypothetical protein
MCHSRRAESRQFCEIALTVSFEILSALSSDGRSGGVRVRIIKVQEVRPRDVAERWL